MSFQFVKYEKIEHVVRITMSRPERSPGIPKAREEAAGLETGRGHPLTRPGTRLA